MNPYGVIDALADRLAESFAKALRPKLAALVDEQIARARAELLEIADPVTDQVEQVHQTIRHWIP